MLQWLKNRLTRTGRARPELSVQPDAMLEPKSAAAEHRRTLSAAKQLCAAIDRGAELKLWDHVDRLAESASKLAWFDAPLAERLAKVKLAQGDPETAMAMLDLGVASPASLRLLRVMCQLRAGARTEAQLALLDWSRHGDLPAEGQLLSALLEWHAGEHELATSLLRDAAASATDDMKHWTQSALMLIAAAQGQWDRATARARSLADTDDGLTERELAIMLDSLRLGNPIDPEQQRHERIEQIAGELPDAAHLIEPLVEAQRRSLDMHVAEELLEAIKLAFEHMGEHQAEAAEGIARLCELLGEREEARTWAKYGLTLNPMSARLVLLLNELAESDATNQEQAA